jgi:poly(3-hydroxybutyrate) depolymerase
MTRWSIGRSGALSLLGLALSGVAASGCGAAGGAGAGAAAGGGTAAVFGPPDPGVHQRTIPGPGGRELNFTVSVPPGYDGFRRVPLVLALHFGGDSFPPFFGRGMLELLVQPALQTLGAVMVAPDAQDPGWDDANDETRVLYLLEHVMANFAIDRKRVLCTGYSMGGAGTWYLVGRHPDRFTAAIPIAGRPPSGPAAAVGRWTVPVRALHGRRDELIPVAPVESHVAELRSQGADADVLIVDDLSHYDTDRFVEPLRNLLPWLAGVWK